MSPETHPPTPARTLRGRIWKWAALAASAALLASAPLLSVAPAQAAPTAPAVQAAPATANGCSYGTGGPLASSLCWIDMSAFGSLTGAEIRGNSITKPMSLNIGGYAASFDITVAAGPTGSVGLTSAAFGTDIWSRAILGNTIAGTPYYTGTSGAPALYELADATSPYAVAGPRETVTLNNLVITNPSGQPVTGYSLVMTDAESTNTNEGFVWTSDVPLKNLQEVVPTAGNKVSGNTNAAYGTPCNSVLTGFGTTSVTCQSLLLPGETSVSARGIVMVQADGATTVSAEITGRGGSGRQGIAFAIALPPVADDSQVTINPNQVATLNPSVRPGTKPITDVTFDNGQTTKTVPGEGVWSITLTGDQPVATFTPEKDYDGPVTTQPYTVTDESGATATAKLSVTINTPPATTDQHRTIDPNQTATLTPTTTPGTGPITGVVFDNGQTTKTVAGEGVWSITLTNGQPVATFTPEKDYHGPVTTQPYTVTDSNGLTATAKLSIDINTPPATTDQHRTIDPNRTATLTPTTTPGTGPITGVVFDNGQTTKTVPGEGVWSITLTNGQPVATFTPEKDYHGPVTTQPYTVTDTSGLTATAKLSIDITSPVVTPAVQGPATPIAAAVNTGGEVVGAVPSAWAMTLGAGVVLLGLVVLMAWRTRASRRS
ncbi:MULTISPECIES: hypothetical protein [unclassified Leifsonia]|uniref:Ig-like domain-containing protein n=1 Tax=unclassified Leifsonia TaxID=2663824 RepID=UPI0008A7D394|nr:MULTISPECIES: hypothetical protein [unclassified Leifsonia]SEI17222.1 CshA-type fibril repeat-containing protein [Leifsonia sp. CL154]SFM10310.1 CshA-type fibril repeat-containing protein [Leifsonia sp. CL147]